MTEQLRERIDSTAGRYEAEQAKLYRPDGSKRHADQEHQERSGALRETFNGEMDRLETEITEKIARRETALVSTEFSDSADALTAEELQKANGRRELIAEDARDLSMEDLIGRFRAALASGDRSLIYLWCRYAGRRAEDPKVTPAGYDDEADAAQSSEPGSDELRDLVAQLDQALRPAHSQAVETARQDLENARDLQDHARLRRQGYTSVLDRHFANQYGHVPTSLRR
jgi:hypothetical protein